MTSKIAISLNGASSASNTWTDIKWPKVEALVKRLQMRIAKATREGRYGKAKALQWLLTHSYYPKLVAVRRVTQSHGGKTPGIDNIVWRTAKQKMDAALSLNRKGYRTQPLKRIYIPKKNGKLRPLSIPPMKCRAMQMLHLLALEPVVEMKADMNAYGFRPKRSTADAIEQCFKVLAQKQSAQYILEGDIKACFDNISRTWMLNNITMDLGMLKKWFEAGYIDKDRLLHQMEQGVSQGSPISPAILNATLAGLEQALKANSRGKDKVHICVYADDFIITAANKETLEKQTKPFVAAFLNERGLELSQEKTKVTHIKDGFNFLGHNIRKYGDKLLIKPSKESIKSFLNRIREVIKENCASTAEELIRQLNPKIRGWTNYFQHVVAKRAFAFIEYNIFKALWKWAKRRHPRKNTQWIRKKYFRSQGLQNWIFYAPIKSKNGVMNNLDLIQASKVTIRRHVKIRAECSPYDPYYQDYFKARSAKRSKRIAGSTSGLIKA